MLRVIARRALIVAFLLLLPHAATAAPRDAEQPAEAKAESTVSAVGVPVDLLSLVQLERDRIAGRWSWQDGKLAANKGNDPAMVLVPQAVPAAYVLDVVASRPAADNNYPSLVLGLVVDDHMTTLIIDAEQRSALWPLDGRPWQDNPTTTKPELQFANDTPATVRCTVDKDRVRVEFEGRPLIDFQGDLARLDAGWELPRRDRLVLGSLGGFRFERVTLTPLAEIAAEPAAPAETAPAAPVADADSVAPAALPDAERVEAERQRVRQSLAEQYAAAATSAKRLELAEKLLRSARSSQDSIERTALYFEAQQKSLEAGRVPLAFEALDALSADQGLDRLQLSVDFVALLGDAPNAYIYAREIIRVLSQRSREALLAGRVGVARRLAEQSLAAATRVRDRTLIARGEERVAQLKAIAEAKAAAKPQLQALSTEPTNPRANLAVGRFYALAAGDWKAGLKHLAEGGDATLASAARADLATGDSPADRLATADRWWQLAESETGLAAEQLRGRAGHWYRLSVGQLEGVDRQRAEKRLIEVPDDLPFLRLSSSPSSQAPDAWLFDLVPDEVHIWKDMPLLNKRLVVGEIEVPHSILMHPNSQSSAQVAYRLSGEHGFLVGKVGLNGSMVLQPGRTDTPLVFRIVGDGHVLWQSRPIDRRGDSQKFSVGIGNVEKLELFVDCPGGNGHAHAIWINCVLTNDSKSKRPDLVPVLRNVNAPPIELLEARWGGGNNWANLTEQFKPLPHGSLLVATSELWRLSDPTPGWKKQCVLKLRIGEDVVERWYGENQLIVVGAPQLPADNAPHHGLQIDKAAIGAAYNWIDVTKTLQSRVVGSQLAFRVDAPELDVATDPLPGVGKTMFVAFRFEGQPHLAIFHDRDLVVLGLDQ